MNRQQRRAASRRPSSPASETVSGFGVPVTKMFQLALAAQQSGNYADAIRRYRQILSIDPKHLDSLHMLALLAHYQGHFEIAIAQLRQAIALDGRRPEFHHNLGNMLREAGKLEEAEACYRRALDLKPNLVDALYNLGNLCQQLERLKEAVDYFERASALRPNSIEILNNLGTALHDQGEFNTAIASYQKALTLQPNSVETLANYASALRDLGDLDEAVEQYQRALLLMPDHIDALIGIGAVLREQGKLDAALAYCERASTLAPDRAEAHNNLALAHEQRDDLDRAFAHYQLAVSLDPKQPEIYINFGRALDQRGQFEEAMACYEQAIALKPDSAEARYNRSLLLLLRGDFAEGWAEYEWRWRLKTNPERSDLPQPRWSGEPLEGKTILIQTEQGFGDSLQFLRYVPAVAQRGANVVVAVPGPLLRLVKNLRGVAAVITEGDRLPEIDFHCPLLSLPHVFGTVMETIPATVPYLLPPQDTLTMWSERLRSAPAVKIGLVWSGNPANRVNPGRSIPVSGLAPLWEVAGIQWFSLQVGSPAADIAHIPTGVIEDLSPLLTDFAETAAAICNLDLVISVETAVAHLAGALGHPVWVPLAVVPAWRWLLERADSPWYPTMHLFRQTIAGDWTPVIEAIRDRLIEIVRARGALA
jgi:tetratricopeptide (TPR) repeat protein